MKPDERLRGLVLLGHGSSRSFLFSTRAGEHYGGTELAALLEKQLARLPIAPRLSLYLGSCLGACDAPQGPNIQQELSEDLWRKLKEKRPAIEQLDVIAHRNMSGSEAFARFPGLRSAIRTGIPEKIDRLVRRIGKTVYGVIAVQFTPLVLGLLAPLYYAAGLPAELSIAAFVAGVATTGALMVAVDIAGAETVTRVRVATGATEKNRQILRDALHEATQGRCPYGKLK